ncbi:ATP-binding protein [Streptomyces halobius]|uniref:ATP-binding protein n=1 Tax=Streptomyces halobius TaxID=2879846 RepID=A0ABY4M4R0_9ACTN|nr:ATP-binding protein [Streptomyces halobius]UQA92765.1 ATP-binding protein [Streptomyces halobius]
MNSTARTSGAFSLLSENQPGIGEFAMRFTSTPRGARLARRLVSHRLDEWGYSYDSEINESVTAMAGELAANAVRHGHVPGRDFALRLTVSAAAGTFRFRVEVSDTRGEGLPSVAPATSAGGGGVADPCGVLAENGLGLLIVGCLAARWGVVPRPGGPGKTVWAEYAAATRRPER